MRIRFGRRFSQLLLGLFLYGIAISAMVQAAVGLSPWDVLAQGVSLRTGIPFGLVTNIVGAAVLLLWIPIRQRPGLGTILNVILIGPSAQLGLAVIPRPALLWEQILLFAGGLLLLAIATGLYIGAHLGPGPRDGLMTGLHTKTGRPIWAVRTAIEVTVLVIGWLLGGNVGFGTLAFALSIGPLCNLALPFFAVRMPAPAGRVTSDAPAGRVTSDEGARVSRPHEATRPTDSASSLRSGDILIEPDSATRARWDHAPRWAPFTQGGRLRRD